VRVIVIVVIILVLTWIISDPVAAAHEVHHWATQVGVFLTNVSK